MKIDVLTLFPELIDSFVSQSLIGQAISNGVVSVESHNFRSATNDKHKSVDDSSFGGGPGMVLKPEPIFDYVESHELSRPIIYLSPTGETFNQELAQEFSELDGFTLLCGRYEGVDQRVRDHLVDREVSVGDYVLAGGEAAALIIVEAACRLVPGVLGNAESFAQDSFSDGLLEHPQYTRPAEYRGWDVPAVLLSGDHKQVELWRKAYSLYITYKNRPDMIEERGGFSQADLDLLNQFNLSV